MKKRTLPQGLIGDLYENDVWVRRFMDECFLMWGFPCSSLQCMSQTDRSMFAWGMLHLVQSLTMDKEYWWGMREKVKPNKAAWEFSRRVYEKSGIELMPSMPSALPDNVKKLAYPSPMKVDGADTPVSGSSSS